MYLNAASTSSTQWLTSQHGRGPRRRVHRGAWVMMGEGDEDGGRVGRISLSSVGGWRTWLSGGGRFISRWRLVDSYEETLQPLKYLLLQLFLSVTPTLEVSLLSGFPLFTVVVFSEVNESAFSRLESTLVVWLIDLWSYWHSLYVCTIIAPMIHITTVIILTGLFL